MSSASTPTSEQDLRRALKDKPSDWESRKQLAHLLYDQAEFQQAADLIWAAEEIPSVDLELAFAARVLAKAEPRKAIRLLTAVLEQDRGKAVQNLGLANALLHHGMVLQAARFYGAALEADPSLGNADLEHFILWTDDEETLWGDFKNRRPELGNLPWMKRDPKEAMKLTTTVSRHTSPIRVPNLKEADGEQLTNELYQQKAKKGAEPTPPPAVTIPVDRVEPKDRLFDAKRGAPEPSEAKPKAAPAATVKKPQRPQPVSSTPKVTPTKAAPPKVVQPAKPAASAPAAPKAHPRQLQFATPLPTTDTKAAPPTSDSEGS